MRNTKVINGRGARRIWMKTRVMKTHACDKHCNFSMPPPFLFPCFSIFLYISLYVCIYGADAYPPPVGSLSIYALSPRGRYAGHEVITNCHVLFTVRRTPICANIYAYVCVCEVTPFVHTLLMLIRHTHYVSVIVVVVAVVVVIHSYIQI